MTQLEKGLILTELADRLIERGSWCGHTHLQKSAYFLQELLGVDLGVEFMLYKHGPYSFDLEEVILWCQTKFLLEKEYRAEGYGPRLKPTATSQEHRTRFSRLFEKITNEMDFVAERLGSKGGIELERLATAMHVTRELSDHSTIQQRAERLHAYKPHVSEHEAMDAVREFDRLAADATAFVAALGDRTGCLLA